VTSPNADQGAPRFYGAVVVDDEQYMNPVPPQMRNAAALVEPLTIAEKR
jgi:hypothetical protein